MQLVAFDSCEQLAADLRKAAKASVGPFGFPGSNPMPEAAAGGARTMAQGAAAAGDVAAPATAAQEFSGTNNHEQSADEPDFVKTDGRRIVTTDRGTLRVVDAASRKVTGRLDLGLLDGMGQVDLLLSGDLALVISPSGRGKNGPELILVNLAGPPTVVSRYQAEGQLVDARLTGGTARIVVKSVPRISFPNSGYDFSDEKKRVSANRKLIDNAPLDAWLPSWEVTTGTQVSKGQVDCGRVSRPAQYSAGSLVSVLTFDLTRPTLGNGDPVTVVADGDTVYATADSLYLAADQRWEYGWFKGRAERPVNQKTDLYRFTTTGNQPPVYAAAGSVPGVLINQYAMSEWDGHLRVATTDEQAGKSAVRVLRQSGEKLVQTGIVDGLGKNEKIYSVRFLGPRGYVVTFRQTDPLYSLDLSDPAQPEVTGELKITGYSAHLQPAGEGRLIGVGQEADENGRVQGTQVSLFDVSDPAAPRRLAQQQVVGGQSEAEYDPHALLWWPATNLLVVPVWSADSAEALALRVTGSGIETIGKLEQPAVSRDMYMPGIRRSLVIGDVLWTVSDSGLQASNLSTMDKLSWLPN